MSRIKLVVICLIVVVALFITGSLDLYMRAWSNVVGIDVPIDKNPTSMLTEPATQWFNQNLNITWGWVLAYLLLILLITITLALIVGGFVLSALACIAFALVGYVGGFIDLLIVFMFIPGALLAWKKTNQGAKVDRVKKILMWILIIVILLILGLWASALMNIQIPLLTS